MDEPKLRDASTCIEQGQFHLRRLEYGEALNCLRQALILNPSLPEGWLNYGAVLEKLGCYGAAIAANSNAQKLYSTPTLRLDPPASEPTDAIAAALSLQDSSADYWLQRGHVLCDLGCYDEAIASYETALTLRPNDPQSWFGRGNMTAALGRFEEAIASYDKATEFEPSDYQAWNNRGYALHRLGQYEAAIASYTQAISCKSNCYPAWNNRGYALYYLGQHEAAIIEFDQALALHPRYPEAWHNRANALRALGQLEEAIANYDKALALKPEFEEAQENRAIAQQALQADATGNEDITEEADINWVEHGNALFGQGCFEEAIASYDKALEFKPDDYQAWYYRSFALGSLGQYEAAISGYDKALEFKPDDHQAWGSRAIVLYELGQYEAAISSYDKVLEFKPDDHQSWNNRGNALCELGQYEDAINSYDEALKLTQNQYWKAWDSRGLALLYGQGYQSALKSWQEGIDTLQIDYSKYQYGCGQLYYRKGNIQYTEGAKQLNPFPDWFAAKDSYLKALQFLSVDDYPRLHLTILQELLTLHTQLLSPQENLALLQDASAKLQRILQNPELTLGQRLTLERQFEGFNQLQVDALAQQNPTQALELAEESKNRCLGRLRDSWAYQSPPYAQIQTLLSPRTAAIYWHLSPAALTTFILRHNQPPQVLASKPAPTEPNAPLSETAYPPAAYQLRELDTWLKTWKQDYATARDLPPQAQTTSPWRQRMEWMLNARLRTILETPRICLDYLQNIDQLILIPHRDLHLIPLHALFPERYTVTYLPSAQLGLELQHHPTPSLKRLLSIEDPATQWVKAKGGTNGMLYAQLESALVTQLYGKAITQSVPRETATKLRVTAALKLMSGCIHFTGHSYHNQENPAQSALALAGEDLLTLKDLWQLDLHQYNLVCLSSCETGITSTQAITDEYIGLISGFLCAGAAHVISTLWPVDEISSALLMIEFHRNLLKEALPPAQALAQAQQWLRTVTHAELSLWYQARHAELAKIDPYSGSTEQFRGLAKEAANAHSSHEAPFSHPYHWAGFTLTGKVPESNL